jgi:hypothetical protein
MMMILLGVKTLFITVAAAAGLVMYCNSLKISKKHKQK